MAIPKKNNEFLDSTGDSKKSGYTYNNKEIILSKPRGRPPTFIRNPTFYSQESKVDAATLYAVYGDVAQVSNLCKVPEKVIRGWKEEPWWFEIQKKVYLEQNDNLAVRISKVLDTTITQLEERLDKGDEKINPKTGEIVSIKVEASVLAKMFENLSHQRRVTKGDHTINTGKVGIDDRLKLLEAAFVRFASAKEIVQEDCNAVES